MDSDSLEELELDIEPASDELSEEPEDITEESSYPELHVEQAVPTSDDLVPHEQGRDDIPEDIRSELKTVLSYLDQLLESLPEEKIQEFAQSEHFDVYKRLFEELGLAT